MNVNTYEGVVLGSPEWDRASLVLMQLLLMATQDGV